MNKQSRTFLRLLLAASCLGFATAGRAQTFITNGLVSYYSFDGNANDAIGSNNGVVVGATLAPDMFGSPNKAYSFQGTNSWILTTDTDFPDGNKPRTVSMWVTFRSYGIPSPTDTGLFSYGSGGANDTFYAILFGAARPNNPIAVGRSGGGDFPQVEGTLLNHWYHIVLSHDGSTSKIYLDGALKAMANRTYDTILDGNFYIGSYTHIFGWSENDPCVDGVIDNVRVYNRALTDEEVSQLFAFEGTQTLPMQIEVASVHLKWPSEAGAIYDLQYSTAIKDWTLLKTFGGTGGMLDYIDLTQGEKRFYRVIKN